MINFILYTEEPAFYDALSDIITVRTNYLTMDHMTSLLQAIFRKINNSTPGGHATSKCWNIVDTVCRAEELVSKYR